MLFNNSVSVNPCVGVPMKAPPAKYMMLSNSAVAMSFELMPSADMFIQTGRNWLISFSSWLGLIAKFRSNKVEGFS